MRQHTIQCCTSFLNPVLIISVDMELFTFCTARSARYNIVVLQTSNIIRVYQTLSLTEAAKYLLQVCIIFHRFFFLYHSVPYAYFLRFNGQFWFLPFLFHWLLVQVCLDCIIKVIGCALNHPVVECNSVFLPPF